MVCHSTNPSTHKNPWPILMMGWKGEAELASLMIVLERSDAAHAIGLSMLRKIWAHTTHQAPRLPPCSLAWENCFSCYRREGFSYYWLLFLEGVAKCFSVKDESRRALNQVL